MFRARNPNIRVMESFTEINRFVPISHPLDEHLQIGVLGSVDSSTLVPPYPTNSNPNSLINPTAYSPSSSPLADLTVPLRPYPISHLVSSSEPTTSNTIAIPAISSVVFDPFRCEVPDKLGTLPCSETPGSHGFPPIEFNCPRCHQLFELNHLPGPTFVVGSDLIELSLFFCPNR
ncbi:hypothetical protein NE237_029439 [Protea cynaroides]|uniref:Uncharacterized protein n=1 Tax=Protea cynaroides TaxID=273540 RepID=A0A9Q0JV33_9MAGN|nr:hypothetical protein NE237_029439 [Protea cynaroides]